MFMINGKTNELIAAYQLLKGLNVSTLPPKMIGTVIPLTRAIRNKVRNFEETRDDILKAMKDGNHDKMTQKLSLARAKKITLSPEEEKKMNEYFAEYNKRCTEALEKPFYKEHELKFDYFSPEDFNKIIEKSEWSVEQTMQMQDFLCGKEEEEKETEMEGIAEEVQE